MKYFTITGIQKSGNTWLTAMVRAMSSVTLQARSTDLPFQLRCVCRFVEAYNRRVGSGNRLLAADVAGALLNHESEPVAVVSREAAESSLRLLARQMAFDGTKGLSPAGTTVDVLVPLLLELISGVRAEAPEFQAYGAVGKHLPLNLLRQNFPEFKVIWVIRDPRDVLISWFYHDLRAMTPHKARHFIAKPGWARMLQRLRLLRGEQVPLALRSDWKESYFADRAAELCRFYADSWAHRDQCLLIRYEDLLTDCRAQLQRVADFLGVTTATDELADIERTYSFTNLTGGVGEVVGGHVRRGQSGDWQNYFDTTLLESLPAGFTELVQQLGYERSNEWCRQVPAVAPRPFETSRLNVRGSAVRALSDFWKDDVSLQQRFVQPINDLSSGTFYEWLCGSSQPRIRDCLRQLHWLAARWGQLELPERPLADRVIHEGHAQAGRAA